MRVAPLKWSRPSTFQLILTVALVVVVVVGGFLYRAVSRPHSPTTAEGIPYNAAIEARWGIRVTQIAVTAAGGLVDLRYVVLDADRAHAMMQTLMTTPAIETSNGTVIRLKRPIQHRAEMENGRTYYILYVNQENILRTGSQVTVLVEDQRIGPFIVK